MPEPTSEFQRNLELLETALRQLETQYNMFFSGRVRRPPLESRARVDAMVRRLDRESVGNYADRFRFTTLQTRYAKFVDLWDRAIRAREEGRRGPFSEMRSESGPQAPVEERVLYAATLRDPLREMDKVEQLYEQFSQARREADPEAQPLAFHKFVDDVRKQIGAVNSKGKQEVAFQVTVKGRTVGLTVQGSDGKKKTES